MYSYPNQIDISIYRLLLMHVFAIFMFWIVVFYEMGKVIEAFSEKPFCVCIENKSNAPLEDVRLEITAYDGLFHKKKRDTPEVFTRKTLRPQRNYCISFEYSEGIGWLYYKFQQQEKVIEIHPITGEYKAIYYIIQDDGFAREELR